MKNLFDYATSELSQDAFLRWLFENYNCENEVVKEAVYTLLRRMTGIDDLGTGTITELKTTPQFKHMDVVVEFTHNEKRHILVIEDKTFSGEHSNQFEIYRKNIEKEYEEPYKNNRAFFVFYKTDIKIPEERNRAVDKNWKPFYLDEIYHFFEEITNTDCLIFEQYREHIKELYQATKTVSDKPMNDWKEEKFPLVLFRTYIIKELFPLANKKCPKALGKPKMQILGWHSYRSFALRWETQGEPGFSLEILFRRYSEQAEAIVQVWKSNNDRAEDTVREDFQEKLFKHTKLFRPRKHKWCVASGTEELDKRLRYSNKTEDITKTCEELIDAFVKAVKEMKSVD